MKSRKAFSFFRPVQQAVLAFVLSCLIIVCAIAMYSTRWVLLTLLIGIGLGGLANIALTALNVSATTLGGLIFIVVVCLYYCVAAGSYFEGLINLLPAHLRPRTREVLVASAASIRKWFFAQLLAMLIIGVLAAVGLKLIGSNYWLMLGGLSATLELVPFIGPIVMFVSAVGVTLATQPEHGLWVAVEFIVLLRVEGDLLIPLLMRGRVKLPPIHLITLMLILGSWFGVLGFIVATPVLAVFRTVYQLTYLPMMNSKTLPGYEKVLGEEKKTA